MIGIRIKLFRYRALFVRNNFLGDIFIHSELLVLNFQVHVKVAPKLLLELWITYWWYVQLSILVWVLTIQPKQLKVRFLIGATISFLISTVSNIELQKLRPFKPKLHEKVWLPFMPSKLPKQELIELYFLFPWFYSWKTAKRMEEMQPRNISNYLVMRRILVGVKFTHIMWDNILVDFLRMNNRLIPHIPMNRKNLVVIIWLIATKILLKQFRLKIVEGFELV